MPRRGPARGSGARGRRGTETDKLSAPRPPPGRRGGRGEGPRRGPGSGGDARSGWGRRRPSLRRLLLLAGPGPRPPAPRPSGPNPPPGRGVRRRAPPPRESPQDPAALRPPHPPPPPRPGRPPPAAAAAAPPPDIPGIGGAGSRCPPRRPRPSRSGSYLPACFRQPFPLRAPHPPPPRDRDPERAPRTAAAAGPATPPPPRTRPGPAPRPTHCARWATRLPLTAPPTNRPAPGVSLLSGRSVLSIRPIGWSPPNGM